MKFVSIDLETTGLDGNVHGVIDFAAVYADLSGQMEPKTFHVWLNPEGYVWSNYCLNLHRNWLEKVIPRVIEGVRTHPIEPEIISPTYLAAYFSKWLYEDCEIELSKGEIRVTPAGKNFSSFDLTFMPKLGMSNIFRHRALDPTALYIQPEDKVPPELSLCKNRATEQGCKFTHKGVSHTALDDAWDVVKLLQWAYRHDYARQSPSGNLVVGR